LTLRELRRGFAATGIFDHCKSLLEVLMHAINVFANKETLDTLPQALRQVPYVHEITEKTVFETATFRVQPFSVRHDVPCLGFVIQEKATKEHLLFVTDFFNLRQRFTRTDASGKKGLVPFDIVAIALNYNAEILDQMVKDETINEVLAKRLLRNHPSEQWVINYLEKYVDLSQCRELHFLHGSNSRLAKEKTKQAVKERLYMDVK